MATGQYGSWGNFGLPITLAVASAQKKADWYTSAYKAAVRAGHAPLGETIAGLQKWSLYWTKVAKQNAAKKRQAQTAAMAAGGSNGLATTTYSNGAGAIDPTTGLPAGVDPTTGMPVFTDPTTGAPMTVDASGQLVTGAAGSGLPTWAPYAAVGVVVLVVGAIVMTSGKKPAGKKTRQEE